MRDKRIDQLGFLSDLQKHYGDDLKTAVKVVMTEKDADRAAGDLFDALLVQSAVSTADPDQFLQLFFDGVITRAQLVASIRVSNDAALDAIGREKLESISSTKPGSPALRISRKKGVEISLVKALQELALGIAQLVTSKGKAA